MGKVGRDRLGRGGAGGAERRGGRVAGRARDKDKIEFWALLSNEKNP